MIRAVWTSMRLGIGRQKMIHSGKVPTQTSKAYPNLSRKK